MKNQKQDTPPSSINGDEITEMDEEEVAFIGHLDELILDDNADDEDMEEYVEDDDMEPQEDDAEMIFEKHTDAIYCCDLHPNGKFAVTGGGDNTAYIWNVESGEIIMECTDFKDSIICAAFSFDGAFVAIADMLGLVKVWECKLDSPQHGPWTLVFEESLSEIVWGFWHFGTNAFFCGTESGQIFIYKIPTGEMKVLQSNNVMVECAKVLLIVNT